MKRIVLFFIILIPLFAASQPKNEVRAVWLTTIGGIDWPSSYAHNGMGISEQKRQLTEMLDRLQAVNVNTILLQTRVRGTTIYPSDIEPWDGCLSGRPGQSPGYDALQFAIDECHRRGMELHAWVVTIPVGKWNTYGCQQLRRKYGRIIQRIKDEGYMNPESGFTASYLADICGEITRKYDIDGIHLDYIRYPETWRGRKYPQYITNIVEAIHDKVKFYKPWVKLSCSPIGKYDDLSRYRSNGWNARSRVAQDAQGWLRDGLMDQLYPMMYFSGNNFYPFAIDWQEASYGRQVISGLGVYMLHPHERNWPLGEMQRQMNFIRHIGMGHCYFRAKFLLDNVKGIYDYVAWHDRHPALIPPMQWTHGRTPSAPTLLRVERTEKGDMISWGGARDNSDGPYLIYNVYASEKYPVDITKPEHLIRTRHLWSHLNIQRSADKPKLYYAVTAQDRYGYESAAIQESMMNSTTLSASSMMPHNGKTLKLQQNYDARQYVVMTLQGQVVKRYGADSVLDITMIPDGIYQLKSVNKKRYAHRIGYFVVKR